MNANTDKQEPICVDVLMDNCGALSNSWDEVDSLRAIISVMHGKLTAEQWAACAVELEEIIAESSEAAEQQNEENP